MTIREAVERTVDYLVDNDWVLDRVEHGLTGRGRHDRGRRRAVAIVGCGLIGAKRAAALRGAGVRSSPSTTLDQARPTRWSASAARRDRGRAPDRGRGLRARRRAASSSWPPPTPRSRPLRGARRRARAATCSSRSRAAAALDEVVELARGGRAGTAVVVRVGFNHRFHPAIAAAHEAGGRRALRHRCCTCAPATATADGSATSRSGGPTASASGRRRAARPGRPPHRPHPVPRRATSTLGVRRAAHRRSGRWTSRTTRSCALRAASGGFAWLHASAGRSGRTCSRSRSRCRAAKLEITGPRRQLRPGAADALRDAAESSDPRRSRRGSGRRATTRGRPRSSTSWRALDGGPRSARRIDDAVATLARGRRGVRAMIITRTPLRISLGGGGTDLPSLLPRRTAAASSSPRRSPSTSTSRCTATSTTTILLKYSQIERVTRRRATSATRSSARRCVRRASTRGVEISSMADIPAGTGLGSSGAFTVGVLQGAAPPTGASSSPTTSSPQLPATSRSTASASRSASRTSTSPPSAGSRRSSSTPTSTVDGRAGRRCPDDARGPARGEPAALLHGRAPLGVGRARRRRTTARRSATPTSCDNLDEVREARPRDAERALRTGDLDAFGALLTDQWKLKYDRAPSAAARAGRRLDPRRPRGRCARRQARRRRRRRVPAVLRRGQGRAAGGDGRARARGGRASASTTRAPR